MSQDKRAELYRNLIGSGKVTENEIGSEKDFMDAISDEATAREFYHNLINSGTFGTDEIGEEDDFYNSISSDFEEPAPKPAKPVQKGMTEAERQAMIGSAEMIKRNVSRGQKQAFNRMDFARGNTGLKVTPVNIGENRNVVEQQPTFNPETGKVESTYITESGNEYGTRELADTEQNAIDASKTLTRQLDNAYRERDRLNDLARKRIEALKQENADKPWYRKLAEYANADKMLDAGAPMNEWDNDEEYSNLMTALRMNNAVITALEDAKNGDTNSFWHSFGKEITNGYTFSFGGSANLKDVNSTLDAMKYADMINEKRKAGRTLTDKEQAAEAVIKNQIWDNQVQALYGDQYGAWARAGKMGAVSAELMVDFLMMGGAPLAAAKEIAAGITKQGVKAFGNIATKGLGKYMLKATGVTVGSMMAGAEMANTVGLGRTAADAGKGFGEFILDDRGDYVFGHTETIDGKPQFVKGMDSVISSVLDAERSAIGNYGSEVSGDFLKIGGSVLKGLNKIGLSKIANKLTAIRNTDWYKAYSNALTTMGFDGVPGEALEEYVGTGYNALMGGDEWKNLADPRTHIDIWLGCATMGALLNAPRMITTGVQMAQYYRYKHATDKADAMASTAFGDGWKEVRDALDASTNESITDALMNVLSDETLNDKQRAAALGYAINLQKMRGYSLGQVAAGEEEGKETPVASDMDTNYAEGYGATIDTDMQDIRNLYNERMQRAIDTFGEIGGLDEYPVQTIQTMEQGGYTPEQIQIAKDYVNAKAAYDGMQQKVEDDIDTQVTQAQNYVDSHTNKEDNQVHPVTLKDGREAFITGRNVVMNADGTVNVRATKEAYGDGMIFVSDDNGMISSIDVDDIAEAGAPVDADEQKEEVAAAIRQQVEDEAQRKQQGILPFNEGDTYNVLDDEGQQHTVTILPAVDGEGNPLPLQQGQVLASVDGAEAQPMAAYDIQAMAYNTQQVRVAEAVAEEQAQQDEISEGEPLSTVADPYKFHNLLTINTENGPVRAHVTTEENEDGLIEVYSFVPINGKKLNLFTREELDNMVTDVMPATEEQQEEISAGEPLSIVEEPQSAVAEQPSTAEAEEYLNEQFENAPAQTEELEPMPMNGEDADFSQVTPTRAHAYIYNEAGLSREDADQFVDANKKVADDALKKVKKDKKPVIGTSISKFKKEMQAWQEKVDAAQQAADFWQEVQDIRKQADMQESMNTPSGRMELLEKASTKERKIALAKEMYSDLFDDDFTVANDIMELVALNMPKNISWEDIDGKRGLQSELGLRRGVGKGFDSNAFNSYLAKKGEGISFAEAVHSIYESEDNQLHNGEQRWDDQEIRNALIDMFLSADKPTYIRDYVFNSRVARAEDAFRAEQALEEEYREEQELQQWAMQSYGVTFEEAIGLIAKADEDMKFLDEYRNSQEYLDNLENNGNFANENENENGNTRTGETAGSMASEGAGEGETGRRSDTESEGTLQGQTSDQTRVPQDTLGGNQEAAAGVAGQQVTSNIGATSSADVIAEEEAKVNTNPSEGQKKAGNYAMGHIKVDGFDVTIENPKGSVRSGVDADGKAWSQTMNNTYGYIRGTEGVDGDHIDVFLSNTPEQGNVFVIDQVKNDGSFDEHKVMYGFPDMESARQAYLSNYEEGWQGLGAITEVSKEEFKKWVESSHRKTKPFAEYKSVKHVGETDMNTAGETNRNTTDNYLQPRDAEEEKIVANVNKQLQKEIDAAIKQRDKAAADLRKARAKESDRATDLFGNDDTFNQPGQLFGNSEIPVDQSVEGVDRRTQTEQDAFNEAQANLVKLQSVQERNSRIRGALDNHRKQTTFDTSEEVSPSEQLKPTDLRDAVRPESAEIGVSEAKAKARKTAGNQADYIDPRAMTDEEKQKRGDALRDAVAIDIDSNQIVSSEGISARKAAENWWDENIPEPLFYDTEVGEVEINKKSVESSLAHRYSQAKLDAITSLPDGFENAVYLGTMPDAERRETINHYFAYPINYNGKRCYVFCRALHDSNTNRLYVHEVFIEENIKKGNTLQTAASKPHGGIALYRDILANVLDSEGKGTEKKSSVQENDEKNVAYSIKETTYTNKKGKTTPMHLVTFDRELSKEELRAGKTLAKDSKGWWDSKQGGFMMRSEESAKALAESLDNEEAVADAQPLSVSDIAAATEQTTTVRVIDVADVMQALKEKGETRLSDHGTLISGGVPKTETKTKETGYGANNTLVSKDRYEELKERMRKKLGGQMNMGIDPEILAIGTEMAAFHIEAGARKFADFARNMIADLGDAIRPYLKSFYNGARELPEVEEAGYSNDMTPYDEVRTFDVANFDKATTDAMAAAEEVIKEQEVSKQAEEAVQKITEQRNDGRRAQSEGVALDGTPLRPATDADLDNRADAEYYHNGKRVYIMAVMRSGEQVNALQFSKPVTDRIYLTNGQSVKLDELMTKDDKKEPISPKDVKQVVEKSKKTSKSKNKSVSLQQEPDLFGSFYNDVEQNDNEDETESGRENRPGTAGISSGTSENARPVDNGRLDSDIQAGRNVSQGDSSVQGEGKQVRGSSERPNRRIQKLERPTNPKNTNNNHAERGKDYAPKDVDARIEANIKAIELMQQLIESGEKATPKQMAVLRQFSGWGGLGKAFENNSAYTNGKPTPEYLRELLGEEAYEQANMSRNSAYYTPANVIDTLWDIARAMGFTGGKFLEGSAGIGNIIGLMPTDLSERSNIQAVEIDQTTGNILRLLYPDAQVDIKGFEATEVENGTVDLAITNVPFVTRLRVMDTTGDKDLSKKFHDIHDFCIAKNIRKLREGGIGIFITSSGTLDNSAKLREWIVQDGNTDVVGAFRLNNETFGGTGVTSDIIVVRKRVNGKKSPYAIDVLEVSGERTAEYDTGEEKKVKGTYVPVIKTLSMDYNKYFVEHPEMMAGKMYFGFEKGNTFRPTSKALYPVKGINQKTMLAEWSNNFADKEWEKPAGEPQGTRTDDVYEELGEGVKEGSIVVRNGKLFIAQRGMAVPLDVNANKVKGHTKAECFEAYKAIKDALADLLAYQTENEGDEGLQKYLTALNKAYDSFVKTYGHLHKNTSISFLKNDVDFANILALEKFSEKPDISGKKVQEYGKTDIFSRRVVDKEKAPEPDNVKDGIIASLYVHGRIDIPWITEQMNEHSGETTMRTEDDVRNEILKSGLGFENPDTRQIEVSYEYLSGNVREKLQQARDNNSDGRYDGNIKALEEVVPMNIPPHLIEFNLGSSWIDPKLYEEYIKERTDIDVTCTPAGGTWFVKTPYRVDEEKNKTMGVRSELLKKVVLGTQLIEAAMQNKTITVSETHKKWDGSTETITDKEATQACANKIDEIRADFKDWAKAKMQAEPEMSERIERTYNDMFNNYVPKEIPDAFVPKHFGGAATVVDGKPFSLRPHQGKAVVRGTTQPLLLAHEVGTGKTYTLISTAMEMRRLGTARKPMIVVQNATVGQFVESAKKLYPNAKVLTIEDKDHTGEGRKNFYAKIKYNDWDMIVVPQSVFERIPDSEERQMAYVKDKIEEKLLVLEQMRDADPQGNSMIVRQAEKEIANLEDELTGLSDSIVTKRKQRDEKKAAVTRQNAEVKALEMLDRQTDDVENFDDMGIDAILVDEAHEYKHLGFATAMQRGVKGIDPSYSKKAQGVFLKTQAVLEKNNGRNVIFATGTPISNTAAEIWTFMRYLMPADTMKEYGIYYFDDFVRNFGNIQQMLEFTTSGKFKENNRFAGYVNLPELVRIWAGVADTVLTREAGGVSDKIPEMEGGKAQDLYLPQTKALRSVMKFVKKTLNEYDNMTGKQKKENSHIPLTMYGIAKAAAVDARLVVANAADEEQSKTNEAVRQILKSLEETKDYKGTVAVFADNYQNKKSGFNLYEDIREKLIAAGLPAEQIVVMKSGMSVKKKLEIFDAVNRGDVRVIMGSTFTLGTGVNIQERLHTLIHLDAPNRPMDYTQRNGRILRQGNLHKEMGKPVRVLRFGVEDSLDVTAYQRLKTKGAIADSIMNGKKMIENSMENRALEEEEDVFGDTVAQLSGSEYAMLKNQAEKDVRKYEAKRKQYEADQKYCHNEIPRLKSEISALKERLEQNKKSLAIVEGKPQHTVIIINKQQYANVEATADFLKDYNKKIREAENDLRDNPSIQTQERKLTVNIGGIDFEFTTELTIDMIQNQGQLFTAIRRKMTYSCPTLNLSDVPVKQALLREGLEDIVENVITGNDFRERIEVVERKLVKDEKTLEQVTDREGKPFEFEEELKKAHERFEEYSELMKKELEEKEKKYADMDAGVDAASDITDAEEDDEETDDEDIRGRGMEDENETPIFVSNAMRAVEGIKQEKATPEQWLKMIEKAGGLKAGEDKWLGLSDWLKDAATKGQRTLTKSEVMDYIRENEIQIEEVNYAEGLSDEAADKLDNFNDEYHNIFEQMQSERGEELNDGEIADRAFDEMVSRYGDDFGQGFQVEGRIMQGGGVRYDIVPQIDFTDDMSPAALYYLESDVRPANSTRLNYTTDGLTNKREIALTVPTIESWNTGDNVHFGDAGEGRAVAWVRFGETKDEQGNNVLVIDEIQSKRHQEGRERGYRKEDPEYDAAMKRKNELTIKYRAGTLTQEEANDYYRSWEIINSRINSGEVNKIPDAPFDKNWHELAMKRMLRYAAENGYDKVAWTTGEQQAERYNIGNVLSKINVYPQPDTKDRQVIIHLKNGDSIDLSVDKQGIVETSGYNNKPLSDVVGKPLAEKILSATKNEVIDGDGLRLGAEGMKGFYDEILPRFMNKYGKKWGVKVEDISLPEIGQTMHSVDITPEMQESVMQGQLMFREVGDEALQEWLDSQPTIKMYRSMVLIDGKLYPPMSSKEAEGSQLRQPSELGKWEEAEEAPEAAVQRNGRWVFPLRKDNGKMLYAAYNPYIHTSASMLNDQFSEAQNRDNLVVVEMEVPASELMSEYRAARAKDSVGMKDWKAGVIQGQLTGTRKVMLSRWAKPVRIVPTEEVADNIASQIAGQIDVMPTNVVTPQVRKALEERGVKFVDTDNRGKILSGRYAGRTWSLVYGKPRNAGSLKREGGNYKDIPYSEALAESRAAGYTKKQFDTYIRNVQRRMRNVAEDTVAKLNLGDRVIIKDNAAGLTGDRAKLKGWYNVKTGKIVIVLGNHTSAEDVKQTVLHEAVAHYGLRQLFGKNFSQFLYNVYNSAEPDVRQRIVDLMKKHDWNYEIATEEYLASLAEKTDFERASDQGWWMKIKSLFLDMLSKVGLDFRGELTDNELRYILWRSYENLAEPDRYNNPFNVAADVAMQHRLQVGRYNQSEEPIGIVAEDIRTRETDRDRAIARSAYERMVSTGMYQFQEAVQDSMLGLEKLYKAILGEDYSRIEDIPDYENPYQAENALSSKNLGQQHDYQVRFMKPLLAEISALTGGSNAERIRLTRYMMAKHGLERNEVFAQRDFEAYKEKYPDGNLTIHDFRERDYSGLTSLTGEADVVLAEQEAQRMVDEYELEQDTTDLWNYVNNATKASLDKVYKSGLMSIDTYEHIRDMFEYYIPLQGWDETTSDEVYGYLNDRGAGIGSSPVKHAVGRKSLADDPIATIGLMADAAIRQGNRNLMKQNFYRFVLNHPSDLVSVKDLWLHYDAVADEWNPIFPDLDANDTAEEVERKIDEFEERMQQLAEDEPDNYKRGKDAENVPYKVVKGNIKEHQVLVRRGGRTYVLTINGNPRAAQALNGLTNPDVEGSDGVSNIMKGVMWWNHQLSAFYTTRYAAFVVSNFCRDTLYSNNMTWVKENPRYALRFHKNFGKFNPVTMRRLFGKWQDGTLDMNAPTEYMFYQFMTNGGETGYTNVRDIEAHKKEILKELKRQNSNTRKVLYTINTQLDLLNRAVENCARFAAFVTSREMGRSIGRSIYDAKEVSINFNKKGAGSKMVNAKGQTILGKAGSYIGGLGRLLFVFFNAGVQGLFNITKAAMRHPVKFVSAVAVPWYVMGVIQPIIAEALGGDDDDDKNAYYNLPEYVRRSNICIRFGEQWLTIPLPIEFRAIFGLGELTTGLISGKERYDDNELAYQFASQISQILPIDMLEGGGGHAFIPSTIKPYAEAYWLNKSWSGLPIYKDTPFNKDEPEWTRVYSNTDKTLVSISKWLNENTGGDDFKKGKIDINPAKLEYLLTGTFGGYVRTAEELKKSAETAIGERDFDWRNIFILNRLVKNGDERTANRKLQNEYFKYLQEYNETSRLLRKYDKADEEGVLGMAEKIDFLNNSPEYLRYELFEEYKQDIDDCREELSEAVSPEERKKIQDEMYAIMRELVNQLREVK